MLDVCPTILPESVLVWLHITKQTVAVQIQQQKARVNETCMGPGMRNNKVLSVTFKPKDRVQSREQPILETAHVGQANDKIRISHHMMDLRVVSGNVQHYR